MEYVLALACVLHRGHSPVRESCYSEGSDHGKKDWEYTKASSVRSPEGHGSDAVPLLQLVRALIDCQDLGPCVG